MIVERWTFPVKPQYQEAVVNILKEEIEGNTVFTGSYRIYTPHIGPWDVVVVEWEYEDTQELEAVWDAWFAKSGTPEYFEKWYELTRPGGHREVWQLATQR
jgi:hypothetical protein